MARSTRRPRPAARPPRRPGPWKHGRIPVVGLIGGIGAGKSLAAASFERLGAVVLDADRIGHALLDQVPARDLVAHRFGNEVLVPGDPPRIDRRALAAIIFDHDGSRRDLEAILHPRMRHTVEKAIARAQRHGKARLIVLDAAVLLEAGWDDLCDRVVFVDAPADVRRDRVAGRGWSAEDLERREAAQLPLEVKRRRADVVLTNDATAEAIDEAVGRFVSDGLRPPPRPQRSPGPARVAGPGPARGRPPTHRPRRDS